MDKSTDHGFFPALACYLEQGVAEVEGWLSPTTAAMIAHILVAQTQRAIHGDVCEIGVHHGKLFLVLATALMPAERACAVDIFGDQQKNQDASGAGDRAVFERNAARYAPDAALDIMQVSSLDLASTGFLERRFRFISIDGGHTAYITANDLRVAEATLAEDGVVALDDILSHHWTGVVTGLSNYLRDGGRLVPFALVPNKLLLAASTPSATTWKGRLANTFNQALAKPALEFLGSAVASFDESSYYAREGYTGLHAEHRRLQRALEQSNANQSDADTRAARDAGIIADLRQQMEQDQARIGALAMQAAHLADSLAAASKEAARGAIELAACHASSSWRLTAPLRAARRALARVGTNPGR